MNLLENATPETPADFIVEIKRIMSSNEIPVFHSPLLKQTSIKNEQEAAAWGRENYVYTVYWLARAEIAYGYRGG